MDIDLKTQDGKTNISNIEFDVYLEQNNKTKNTVRTDINTKDLVLYAKVSVKNGGVLNEARITFGDTNFEVKEKTNLEFGKVVSERAATLEIPISFNRENNLLSLSLLKDTISTINLTGKYTNNEGEIVEVKAKKGVQVIWNASGITEENKPIVLESKVVTNKVLNINGENKRILQVLVTSGIENNKYPIKEENIKINMPVLTNGEEPQEIRVATYGDSNWVHTEENNIVNILVKNEPDSKDNIVWEKSGQNEFIITYVYEEGTDVSEFKVSSESKITLYDEENKVLEKTAQTNEINNDENNIFTFEPTITKEAYKSNLNVGEEIVFGTKWFMGVSYKEGVEQISIKDKSSEMIIGESAIDGTNNIKYKSSIINKEEFLELFGNEGELKLYKGEEAEENLIRVIDNGNQADEDGNIVIEYEENINNIEVVTTRPVKEGKLNILHTKSFVPENMTQEDIANFSELKYEVVISNDSLSTMVKKVGMSILDPYTNASIDVNKESFSASDLNEDVEIKVTLHRNKKEYSLYKNPVIFVEFPAEVKNVEIEDLNLIYADGLEVDRSNCRRYQSENGNIIVKIPLIGSQLEYSEGNIAGTQIILNTNIEVKDLVPTTKSNIKLYVHNEIAKRYKEIDSNKQTIDSLVVGYSSEIINFVAKAGVITKDSLSNFDSKNTVIENQADINETVAKLETYESEKTANITSSVLNNYGRDVQNAVILGRLPTEGNKSIVTLEDLESTFSAVLASEITVNGIDSSKVKKYYSTNKDADNDLNKAENGWEEVPTNIGEVKSFLIKIEDYVIRQGEIITFNYNFKIPADLDFDEKSHLEYAVLFEAENNNSKNFERAVLSNIMLTTGQGIDLEVKLVPSTDNQTVHEGERVTYYAEIKNNGTSDLQNVNAKITIPEGATIVKRERLVEEETGMLGYYVYKEYPDKEIVISITEIKVGETKKTEDYMVKIDALPSGQTNKEIKSEVEVYVAGNDQTVKAIDTLTAKKAKFESEMIGAREGGNAFQGELTNYSTLIKNISNEELHNIEITYVVPDGITYESVFVQRVEGNEYDDLSDKSSYNASTRTVVCNIDSLKKDGRIEILVEITGNLLEDGKTIKKVIVGGKVKIDGVEEQRLNGAFLEIVKLNIEIIETSNTNNKTIGEREKLEHKIKITNNSERRLEDVTIELEMPEGVTYANMEPFSNYPEDNKIRWSKSVWEAEETFEYKITVYTDFLPDGKTSMPLEFKTKFSASNMVKDITKETVYTLKSSSIGSETEEPEDPNNPDDPNDPNDPDKVEKTYKIEGIAWIDDNKNGAKEDGEEILNNTQVMLLNAKADGKIAETTTNNEGKYTFDELENGEYLVVFMYDSNIYELTTYKKAGIEEDKNSKVTETNLTINGEEKMVAITDKIVVNNSNVNNINMGVTKAIFDLSLNKYISKATVKNNDGTAIYTYNEESGKTAKIDVRAKNLENTVVIVEYTIAVTNNGEIPGYVKSIVDYMSPGMAFSSELNPNWYEGQNGDVYCIDLAEEELNPGDTKDVKLVLTKTMTSNNTGLTSNSAEIYEAYNKKMVKDINSDPGNKDTKENDYSSADIIITIRTGSPVMYISIVMVCMLILGYGIYIIDRKVLAPERRDV